MYRNPLQVLSTLLFIAAPLAASTFSATSGSANITNTYGGPESITFTLTGPQLTSTTSSSWTPGYNALETLNNSFSFSLSLLQSDDGFSAGSATAGGNPYSVAYQGLLDLTALSNITLLPGSLTGSVSATLSGALNACSTANNCINNTGPTTNPFTVAMQPILGTLTYSYALLNPSSQPSDTFSSNSITLQYFLASATFTTTTPEPGTWIAGAGLALAIAFKGLRSRGQAQAKLSV